MPLLLKRRDSSDPLGRPNPNWRGLPRPAPDFKEIASILRTNDTRRGLPDLKARLFQPSTNMVGTGPPDAVCAMKLDFIDLSKFSVSSANMRSGRPSAAPVRHLLWT
jgi:hypothetical protein